MIQKTTDLLDIKKYPHTILRKRCELVKQAGEYERNLLHHMLQTMRYFRGIGLAAPQVGIGKQLIVADVGDNHIMLINPYIVKIEGKDSMSEGCLSIPEFTWEVERSYAVVVRGLDGNGVKKEIKAEGLLARVLQHEIDHLYGKLIIDYQPFFKRLTFICKNRWNVLNNK